MVIVTTTLGDLESGARTGSGAWLPMADLIRMASHAHHYLAVFDQHTAAPLYLGHTKRLASPAQRLVLHATDRGRTAPRLFGTGLPVRRTSRRRLGRRRTHRHRQPHLRLPTP